MSGQRGAIAERRIRRVQRLQVAVVAGIAVVSVVASIVVTRAILSIGDTREDADRAQHALVDIRADLTRSYAEYWRARATSGEAGVSPVLRERFLARDAELVRIAEDRRDMLPERAPIAELRAAVAELGLVVFGTAPGGVPGSAADRGFVDRSDAAIGRVESAIGGWIDALESAIAAQSEADDRLIARLLAALGGLVVLLIGCGVLLWAATERARRSSIAEIAAERDATLAVMASVQDGVAVLDPAGAVVQANDRLAVLTGRPAAALVGAPPPWAADVPAGFTGEADLEITGPQGPRRVLLTSSPLASPAPGDPGGFVHIVKDVTERVRAEGELRDRAAEQEVLRRVATLVAGGAEPATVFDLVAREVAGLLGVEAGLVTRFDPIAERGIDVGVWTPPGASPRPPARVPLAGDGPVALVHRSSSPVRVDDLGAIDPTSAAEYTAGGFVAAVAAPVAVGAAPWGAVTALTTRTGGIPAGAELRLARFAELVGLTVANADARARLAMQAATDPLTGLANHRAFRDRLEHAVAHARARGEELALIVFDLDRFKDVNDAFGHQAGDVVLAEAARRLAGEARFGELVARTGGEEFAWILPGTDGINAWRAAERARLAVAARPFPEVGTVTASAGVADLTQADDASALMQLADGALYWAKASGRNVTLRYSPDVVKELSATERAERLARSQGVTALRALARAVDAKDPSTARHAERVASVAVRLGAQLGWSRDRLLLLEESALLHDVGKIGVPDALLFAPVPLTEGERATVRQHAALGAEIVSDVLTVEQVGWVRAHHERWNGGGYPDALAGESIPDGARIIAVADAWDAMTSRRAYAEPQPPEEVIDEISRLSGRHFAPDVVAALRVLADEGRLGVTDAAAPVVRRSAPRGGPQDVGDAPGLDVDGVGGREGAAQLGSGTLGQDVEDPVRD